MRLFLTEVGQPVVFLGASYGVPESKNCCKPDMLEVLAMKTGKTTPGI